MGLKHTVDHVLTTTAEGKAVEILATVLDILCTCAKGSRYLKSLHSHLYNFNKIKIILL